MDLLLSVLFQSVKVFTILQSSKTVKPLNENQTTKIAVC